MKKLIEQFWSICLLRTAPQDLPASVTLTALAVILYMTTSFMMAVPQLPLGSSALAAFIDTLLMSGMSYLMLWARLMPDRWRQTLTALAGSGALLGAIAIPLVYWEAQAGTTSQAALMPQMLLLAMLFWNLAVIAHILRHALSIAMVLGALLSTFYLYISIRIIRTLFFVVT